MIRIEVITPERIAFEGEGVLVTVPTQTGILGIGRGHVPLIAPLKAGEVIIRHGSEESEFLAVAGGFVEILPDVVRILADSAEYAQELDEKVIQEAIERAQKAKDESQDRVQLAQVSAIIEHNLARLKVVRRKSSHRRSYPAA